MKKLFSYLASTALAGILLLLPIGIVIFILSEMVTLVSALVTPLEEYFPVQMVWGVDVTIVIGLLSIVTACFVLGFLSQTNAGKTVNDWLERVLLLRLPGYQLAKNLTRGVAGWGQGGPSFQVALVKLRSDFAEDLALVVEENSDDTCTIFVPIAPTPTVGTLHVVPRAKIRVLDVPAMQMMNCVMQWGIGTREMLEAARPPDAGTSRG